MANRLVDRQRELQRLQQVAAAPPALVVLRGRRRVGKSFLLRSALAGPRVLSFQAEQQPLPLQLAAFARECSRLLPGSPPLAFGTWGDAFSFLDAQAKAGGVLVCILDEFQYLAANDASLESTIQLWWDRWDEDTPIVLVLSGSALSFMAGLFGGQRPTHGRSVYRPLLLPLSYRDTAPFAAKSASAVQLIERFAVLGGTPQYQRWGGPEPLRRVIEDVILSPDAPLHRDPEHLIREEDEIREPGPYFGTLEAIADGYTTPTEIAARIGAKSAQLATTYLQRLEELGYLTKVTPLEPGGKGESRAYWKISDPYFRFWFRYVLPNRSRLARGRIKEVANEIERDLPTFIGPIFEDVCREWVGSVSPLGASAIEIGSWWNRKSNVEIDVVALDKKGYTVLGACKWWKEPAGENVLDGLLEARAVLGPKASRAELVIFAKVGFNEKLTKRAKAEGVHLIAAADLF